MGHTPRVNVLVAVKWHVLVNYFKIRQEKLQNGSAVSRVTAFFSFLPPPSLLTGQPAVPDRYDWIRIGKLSVCIRLQL